jgi:DNA-binding transcriptional ArsR family regulator
MDTFSALADPTRRNILELLVNSGQLSATEIFEKFTVSKPAISQHLKVLREAKLVDVEKRAQQRLYQINPATLSELEGWIRKMTRQWEDRFGRLDEILKREKKKMREKST